MPALPKPSYESIALALALGESVKSAYLAGGYKYSKATASRTCAKPEIQARVAELQAERREHEMKSRQIATEKTGIDLAWIEEHQRYVVTKAIRGEPVRDRDGKKKVDPETGEVIYKPDLAAANFGLVTLGRMKGAFIDRTEIGGPGDFSRLADDELDLKIIEVAKELGLPASGLKMLENLTKREAE